MTADQTPVERAAAVLLTHAIAAIYPTPPAATDTEDDETGYRVAVDAATGAVSVEPWSPATVTEDERARLTDCPHEDWCCAEGCACGDCPNRGGIRGRTEADCSCLVRIVEHHARIVATRLSAERDEALARLAAVELALTHIERWRDMNAVGADDETRDDEARSKSLQRMNGYHRSADILRAALTPSPAPDTDGGDHDA